jgi:hypothetical protein
MPLPGKLAHGSNAIPEMISKQIARMESDISRHFQMDGPSAHARQRR